jgi:putative transposase
METLNLKAQSHCVYRTHYHLVMATADLRKVLTRRVLERFEILARERTEAWGGELLELRAGTDYVHLHIELPPKVAVAEFTNALKTGTSRRMRSEFARLRSQKQLWAQSYCVIGGEQAPMDIIAEYLDSQGRTGAKATSNGRTVSGGEAAKVSSAQRDLLSVSEAADRIGVSKPTIYNWINSGAIKARKGSGRGLEIPVEQLAKQEKASANASAKAAAGPKRAPRAAGRASTGTASSAASGKRA